MEQRFTRFAEIVAVVGFLWLIVQSIWSRDYTVIVPILLVALTIYWLYKSMKKEAQYPYRYKTQEATLEFKHPEGHKAVHTLSGEVMANVEGWKLFDSGHTLPTGGSIGEIGEKYENSRAVHFNVKPGLSDVYKIIRVLDTPLPRGEWHTFTHWMELIDWLCSHLTLTPEAVQRRCM